MRKWILALFVAVALVGTSLAVSAGTGYHDCNGRLCPDYSGNCSFQRCCGTDGMGCKMKCVSHYCAEWTLLPICIGWPPCCLEWVTIVFYDCWDYIPTVVEPPVEYK